jgi:cytochrome c oxidase subunit II
VTAEQTGDQPVGGGAGPAGAARSGAAIGGGSPVRDRSTAHHVWRIVAIWAFVAIVGDVVWYFFAAAHVPPGRMTNMATGAQFDFNVLFYIAVPVIAGVWTYGAYALWTWRAGRAGPGDAEVGKYARSNVRLQFAWIGLTTVLVMFLFGFGTYELVAPGGAGGAQGPNPVWTPTSKTVLPIQVIAQQWKFTYRYPTFGGMETSTLVVPNNTSIAFHVTSIDVIHSFWAYQLGVKADANPQVDNVAYATTDQLGTFTVRCSELCGIWHGAMYNFGRVVSKTAFLKWGLLSERATANNTKYLPPFAWTYSPTANGATGVFANTSTQDPYSKVQKYGATTHPGVKVTSPATGTYGTT